MLNVAIVTCAELPELDADEAALVAPLRELGITAIPAVWDDRTVNWDAFDLTVIRCPWDYSERRQQFLDWSRLVPRLHNPAHLVEWNTDKRYLADLAAAGVPVVPTTWIAPGSDIELPTNGQWVLKPSVGAGSRGVGRYRMDSPGEAEQAVEHLRRLHRGGATVMAQPYLTDVDTRGERALIYIDGVYSHSIRKAAMLTGPYRGLDSLYKAETIEPAESSPADRELAETALAAAPADQMPLYARVDLVDSGSDTLLLELELTEPSLFFEPCPPAAVRMARAIAGRIPE